jgi:hypothetical protein
VGEHRELLASLGVSFVAGAVLAVSLIHDQSVNVFTVVLIGFVAIPWFFRVIAEVTFPGGGVKFREIAERQDLQARQLDTLRFLLVHLVPEAELMHLRKLASASRFPCHDVPPPFFLEIRHLRAMGFVANRPSKGIGLLEQERGDVNDYLEITQVGRDYLKLVDEQAAAPR